MNTENAQLMQMAKESLQGKWGLAVKTFLIYIIIFGGLQAIPFFGAIASLLIGGPFALGIAIFTLSLSRNQDAQMEQIFQGFSDFKRTVIAYLLMLIYIFLWTLLLIIPGIIAAISYSMTFFIMAEDPSIGPEDALKKSKQMMDGYKMKYFLLGLRFIGWILLCILTLGIGFLWLMPYMQVTIAKFYDDIKENPMVTENDFTK